MDPTEEDSLRNVFLPERLHGLLTASFQKSAKELRKLRSRSACGWQSHCVSCSEMSRVHASNEMTTPSAIVVGGGLAGMVVARELALRHWQVILLERSKRLGGKAGSDSKNGRLVEHGYHVFPRWYHNVRAIVDRISVRLIDFDRYHFLLPGEYPRRITVHGPSNLAAMWHNTFHGLLPWYHNILCFYSVLDIVSRPLSAKSILDRVSQIGLIRGKWYTSESVAELNQENILKASAIPVYEISAMTAKLISSYWLREPSPFLSVLPGDLQTVFIEPQMRELEVLGVEIR